MNNLRSLHLIVCDCRIFQMSILESEDHGTGTPQGVVLAIVGPVQESPATSRDSEQLRVARMYNLSSLISLARWTVAQKVYLFIYWVFKCLIFIDALPGYNETLGSV